MALQAALAAPFAGFCVLLEAVGYPAGSNDQLIAASQQIRWGSSNLSFVLHVFPPIPVAIAALLPSGRLGLGLAAAILSGYLGQSNLERFAARDNSMRLGWLLVLAVRISPVAAFVVASNFASFAAICLMTVATTGLLDFAYHGTTDGGFFAGLLFGLATMCDLSSAFFAVVAAVAAALLGRARAGHEEARGRALFLVILFPTAAFVGSWVFLEWRFTNSPLGSFRRVEPGFGRFPGGPGEALLAALRALENPLLCAPVLVVSVLLLLRRRPTGALALTLPVLMLVVVRFIGLSFPVTTAILFLQLLSLIAVPERLTNAEQDFVALAGATQVLFSWCFVVYSPQLATFFQHL